MQALQQAPLTTSLPDARSGKPLEKYVIGSPKYPDNARVVKLLTPLEIKIWWLYNEWHPKSQYSSYIQKDFPQRELLHPQKAPSEIAKIEATFTFIRGQYPAIWGDIREKAKWRKVVVENLTLAWVQEHIQVRYPHNDTFDISEANGLVLWKDREMKKYQLYEGNHRISTWLRAGKPAMLPAILFIGKIPKPATSAVCLPLLATMASTVEEVDECANRHPDDESNPRVDI